VITGATGAGSGTYLYPVVMNMLLGTRFKLVLGYKSTPEIDIAIERGEVQARSGASLAGLLLEHPEWFSDGKVVVLTQVGARREASLPEVPLMSELGRTDEEQILLRLVSSPVAIGRPFLAPPGLKADRVARLRQAFDAAMSDPAFLNEADKAKIDLNPVSGEELSKIVESSLDVPPHLVDKVRAALSP
jgi:tripartite-type tricarboxylate transporter receptor subunit TctC